MATLKSNTSCDRIKYTLDLENSTVTFDVESIEILENHMVLINAMLERLDPENIEHVIVPFKTKGGKNVEKVVIEKVPIVDSTVKKSSTGVGGAKTVAVDLSARQKASDAMAIFMTKNGIKDQLFAIKVDKETEADKEEAKDEDENAEVEAVKAAPPQKMKEVKTKVKQWKWNNVCYAPKCLDIELKSKDKEGNCVYSIAVRDFMKFYEANLENIISRNVMNSESLQNEPDDDGFVLARNTKKEKNTFKRRLDKDINELSTRAYNELKVQMDKMYEEEKQMAEERKLRRKEIEDNNNDMLELEKDADEEKDMDKVDREYPALVAHA